MSTLELKSIAELQDLAFFIPDYQRGYRWTRQQVEDLLNDILEFSQRKMPASTACNRWWSSENRRTNNC